MSKLGSTHRVSNLSLRSQLPNQRGETIQSIREEDEYDTPIRCQEDSNDDSDSVSADDDSDEH